jgi:GNAT superfamily N-acetyltransferase
MSVRIAPLTGADLATGLAAVARLRIAVFRAWPYLYDGTPEYEAEYLARFAAAEGAVIVAAYDGQDIIGCATAAPLDAVEPEFAAPFHAAGHEVGRIFYCGESVLLPAYRGQGIGHGFFDHREAQARALGGFQQVAFCSVLRPADHPLRPQSYVPLDAFWTKRGYRRVDGLVGRFAWKDVDQPAETEKPMQFWLKDL